MKYNKDFGICYGYNFINYMVSLYFAVHALSVCVFTKESSCY